MKRSYSTDTKQKQKTHSRDQTDTGFLEALESEKAGHSQQLHNQKKEW